LSSSKVETATKRIYTIVQTMPTLKPNLHLVNLKVAIIAIIVSNKVKEVTGRAALLIGMEVLAKDEKPMP